MKTLLKIVSVAALASAMVAPVASAENFKDEVKTRKAHMQVVKYNMGVLAGMAKGKREYDSALADAAANNMLKLSSMNNMALWPKGSDNEALGDKTKAKPAIWAADSKVGEKHQAWAKASENMAAVAGQGLGNLRQAMGPLGKSCKGCHSDYKAK